MARTKASLRLSDDRDRREAQRVFIAEREITVLREAGSVLFASVSDSQIAALTERGVVVQPHEGTDLLEVPALTFEPVPGVPVDPAPELAAPEEHQYRLVLFGAPPGTDWLAVIEGLGAVRVRDVPQYGAVFRLAPNVAFHLSELDFVTWHGPYHPAYGVDFALTTRGAPFTVDTLREMAFDPAALPAEPLGNLRVGLFDDAEPETLAATVAATGATVVYLDGLAVVVVATVGQLAEIARIPGVAVVERYAPPVPEVSHSRVIVATDQVAKGRGTFLVDLDGAGEIGGLADTGLDTGNPGTMHQDLRGRVLGTLGTIPPNSDPDSGHGTHVAGIIAGDGTGSATTAQRMTGMAPRAVLFAQRLTDPPIRNLLAAYRAGARSHNNSWGPQGIFNNLYGDASRDLDRFLNAHPDLLVVFSAGNSEADVDPPGGDGAMDMLRLAPVKVAKNIICVGASENVRSDAGHIGSYRATWGNSWPNAAFASSAGGLSATTGLPINWSVSDRHDEVVLFSHRGPVNIVNPAGGFTPIGRMRPDIVAPGTNIVSLRASGSAVPGAGETPPAGHSFFLYRTLSGTSMAAPHVTGAGLLVRQYYRTRHARLGRPRLLVQARPTPAAPLRFASPAQICPHRDGVVLAWVTPAAAGAQVDIAASRADATTLVAVDATPVTLATNVGERPAIRLARHGDATLLCYSEKTSGVVLRRLRRDLTVDPAFGTAGKVSVTAKQSILVNRPASLLVAGDRAAVAWVEDTDSRLRFALFDAKTGTAVGATRDLGPVANTSPHGAMAHDGTNYAVVWRETSGGRDHLRGQRLDAAGNPVGAALVLVDAGSVHDPHIAWDVNAGHFLLTWGDENSQIKLRVLTATLDAIGSDVHPHPVPAGNSTRRPYVAAHPTHGAVLGWEDDTEDPAAAPGRYDVYLAMLGAHDLLAGSPLRISDTPYPTFGFGAYTAPDGSTVVAWHSADEANSDTASTHAVAVTPDGAFHAQAAPTTPLVRSGKYVNHEVAAQPAAAVPVAGVSACWAGGRRFLLRTVDDAGLLSVALTRTDADCAPDHTRVLPAAAGADRHAMLWTGTQVLVVTTPKTVGLPTVRLLDAVGQPVPGTGTPTLPERTRGRSAPGLGVVPGGAGTRFLIAYQAGAFAPTRIRLATLDTVLAQLPAPGIQDLVPELAAGHQLSTARHGWFQFVDEENLVLGAWTDRSGGAVTARIARSQRDRVTGVLTGLPPVPVSTVAGESDNAVIAPRPVGLVAPSARQREHLAAYQFRANPAAAWEIRTSRLDRTGAVRPNPAPPAPPRRDVRAIFPGAPGWAAGTDAIEPQLVCTFVDEPLANPGAAATPATVWRLWSPGFGLAFLGRPTGGGDHRLYFTVLDENGTRVQVPQPPAPANPATGIIPPVVRNPAPIVPVSDAGSDVLDYTLAWTGRQFWLTWVESRDGRLWHRQTAITRTGSRTVHDAPSAALLKATLLNGATNLDPAAALPNLTAGFGWGLLDLRQSLAPTPPVTFHARDDAIGSGCSLNYEFDLPPGTQVLRVTLTWPDPPGATVQNPITLHVTPPVGPPGQEYRGNAFAGGLSQLGPPGPLPPVTDTVQQVVVRNPPAGRYRVRVQAGTFGVPPVDLQPAAQPIALVFAGSGTPVPFQNFTPATRNPDVDVLA